MPDSVLELLKDPVHQQDYLEQRKALDATNQYLAVAAHLHSLQDEMATKADSADFLRQHARLNPTAPTYENDVAQLFAQHPRSTGQAVTDALGAARSARSTYLNAVAPGGADEFTAGSPEQNAYNTRFRQTNDPYAARAHAQNVQKGEDMIKTSIANGLIDPNKDFPSWDGTAQNRPAIYNEDGSVNYHQAGLLAAQRAGAITGKAASAQTKSVQEARDLLKSFDTDPLLGDTEEAKQLKPILLKRILDYETQTRGTQSQPAATPTPTSVDAFLLRR